MGWLWRDLLIGWVVFFLLPKSIVIPIYRGMWRSMRETERLDALDRAWLEGAGEGASEGEGGALVRMRPPRPRRPRGTGPLRRFLRVDRARRSRSPRVPR